jgi:hypothetical protein
MIVVNKYKAFNMIFVLINVIFSSWFIDHSSWQEGIKSQEPRIKSEAAMNYEPSTMNCSGYEL